MPASLVVFKIGGSLYDLPDLGDRLRCLRGLRDGPCVFFPGGGAAADVVRGWDATFQLTAESSHALAIDALSLTHALLRRLCPDSVSVATPEDVPHAPPPGWHAVVDPGAWRRAAPVDPQLAELPAGWDVTSDALAAAWARSAGAGELVLVKSQPPPPDRRLTTAADLGLVDPWLSRVAAAIPLVGWCNLRASPLEISACETDSTDAAGAASPACRGEAATPSPRAGGRAS